MKIDGRRRKHVRARGDLKTCLRAVIRPALKRSRAGRLSELKVRGLLLPPFFLSTARLVPSSSPAELEKLPVRRIEVFYIRRDNLA